MLLKRQPLEFRASVQLQFARVMPLKITKLANGKLKKKSWSFKDDNSGNAHIFNAL